MKYEESQTRQSRLLAESHYHVPLPPPRNHAERAARALTLAPDNADYRELGARFL